MPTSYYPDGFPQDPSSAIEAAFFLTEQEKQEWRSWLLTSSEQEKQEFVETLHSIYLDQQKNSAENVTPSNSNLSSPEPFNQLPLQNANAFGPSNLPTQNFANIPNPGNVNQNIDFNDSFNPSFANSQPQNSFNDTAAVQSVQQPTQQAQPIQPLPPIQQPQTVQSFQPEQNLNSSINSSVDELDFDFSDLEKELELQDFTQQQPVAPQIVQPTPIANITPSFDTPSSTQYEPTVFEKANNSSSQPLEDQFSLKNIKPKDNYSDIESYIPSTENQYQEVKSPILKKPASMTYEQPKTNIVDEKDELRDEVEDMLSNSVKTSSESVLSKALDTDYDVEVNKDEKYQKVAEISLLSARQVAELYDTFLETQGKSSRLEYEFKQKQSRLFDKIMEMVTEASVLSDKVLRLNDQVVSQAGDIQGLKVNTSVKGNLSLQSQVNSLREEIRKVERSLSFSVETIEREFNEFRSDISGKFEEISVQLTSAMADTYKVDGVYEKLAKLTARIDMLDGGKRSADIFAKKVTKTPNSKSILEYDEDEEKEVSEKENSKSSISIKSLKKNKAD